MQISAMPKKWLAFLLVVVAAIALGCAAEEAETGPSAEEIARLVSDSVNVSVSQAVAKAVPEGTSADEIKRMVEAAVAASAQPGITRAEVEAAVTASAQAATAGQLTAAEVQRIVDASVQALPAPQIDTSALRPLVEQAVAASVPEGVSADQIAKLVEAAVGGATAGVPTRAELAKSIEDAVKDAGAGQLTAAEVQNIVNASLAATEAAVERAQKAAESAAENAALAAKEAAAAAAKEVPAETIIVEKEVVRPATYGEAPVLASLVRAGKLPPVEQRLPSNPLVIPVVEEIGRYGGVWKRAFTGPGDQWGLRRIWDDYFLGWGEPALVNVVPDVPESWDVSPDGKVYTFHLREGMKWSDGAPFSADDIMFWYNDIILNEELTNNVPGWMAPGEEVAQVTKVDQYTVRFTFAVPYFLFPNILTNRNVVAPAHYLKQFHASYVGLDRLNQMAKEADVENWVQLFRHTTQVKLNTELPRITPWILESPVNSPQYNAVRNPYYHGVDPEGNQLPYIDRIVHDLVLDKDVLNLKAMAGEIDMQTRHIKFANYSLFKENEGEGDYRVVEWALPGGSQASFMISQTYVEDPAIGELLRNRDFRIGLSHAINRDAINDLVYLGTGQARQGAPPPDNPYYPGDEYAFKYTQYDTDTANQFLDKALPNKNAAGFRLLPDGRVATLQVAVAQGATVEVGELVRNDWAKVGVKMDLLLQDGGFMRTQLLANKLQISIGPGAYNNPWLRPYSVFPYNHDVRFAQTHGVWHQSGGEEGVEPTGLIRRLLDIYVEGTAANNERRTELGIEAMRIHADNIWNIGTVGLVGTVVIVKNDMRNVPENAVWGGGEGPVWPEQFFKR